MRRSGYDRPINAVPVEKIPRGAHNCKIIYTKHVYPHYNSKLKVEDGLSRWAPDSGM